MSSQDHSWQCSEWSYGHGAVDAAPFIAVGITTHTVPADATLNFTMLGFGKLPMLDAIVTWPAPVDEDAAVTTSVPVGARPSEEAAAIADWATANAFEEATALAAAALGEDGRLAPPGVGVVTPVGEPVPLELSRVFELTHNSPPTMATEMIRLT